MKTMKKLLCVFLSVCLIFGCVSIVSTAETNDGKVKSELSFATLSDAHYYPESLTGNNCQAWLDYCSRNAKLYRYSDAIVRTAIETIVARNPELKYILVPGDLTKDSEYLAHVGIAEIFREYEAKYGIEFIVIAGNHDINSPRASTFENGKEEPGRPITAEEFREVYADLGYDLAFSEYANKGDNVQGQLSYAVDLDDNYRLIVIDSNIYSFTEEQNYQTGGTVTPELMAWVKALADEAAAQGKTPMVMLHHGLAAHMQVEPSITFAFVLEDYMSVAEAFASWGIHYAFSGHLHTDDVAVTINDDGEALYDIETASITGFPNTYRELTIRTFEDGESEMDIDSVDFDAGKEFTFDGVTYEKGTFKNTAFSLAYGGVTSEDGYADCKEFLMGIVKTYLGDIVNDISEAGSIDAYLKSLDIDLGAIIGGFLEPYIGKGISLGGYNIFSVDNIMWFVNDLLGQVYDLYIKNPDDLMNLVDGLVDKLLSIQVSNLPCTNFIDTLHFGDAEKPGTLGDLVLSAMTYWVMGNEDVQNDAFVLDAIARFESGENAQKVWDTLIDMVLHDLVEDSILGKLEIRLDRLFNDDEIGYRLGEGINYLLYYVLRGDFTYMNLVDTIFGLGVLPYTDLYDILDQLAIQKYITFSQIEGIGIFIAYVLNDFSSDYNPIHKGDFDVTYSTKKVDVPVTRDNYRLPTAVSVTLGEDNGTSANISWYSKSTVDGDIEIYKADSEPVFIGEGTTNADFSIDLKTEAVTRSFPGIDIGFIGFITYEFPLNRHTVKLTGLQEGATYYYRVGDAERDWWSETGTITTADGSDNLTFFHMADPQSQNEKQYNRAWAKTLETAFNTLPDADFIINTGDLVDHGDNFKQWGWMFNTGSEELMNTYMMPASGNHEGMGTNATVNYFVLPNVPEQNTEKGVYYSFDYNNAHIAVINTEDLNENDAISDTQISWLKNDMNASDAEWKFVMLHRAPYSQGSHYKDKDICAIREQLGTLMPELDIDIVFQGHDHVYLRTGSLVNNEKLDYTKTYLNFDGNVYRTQVQPEGTSYVISGTSGVKTYLQNDPSLTDEYFPRGEAIVSVDAAMFSAVRIVDGILYFDAYKVTDNGAENIDRFAIQKDLTQGDINTEYVEPEEPDENTADDGLGVFMKIFEVLFKVLKVVMNVFNIYIKDLI
ncbi:MAG: metallophosphoesterase [Acutalibacteraceae bacterium]|nr:metallophosphoesterase [Acutalibacteraceae bacterium]